MGMSDKQIKFCELFLKTGNATQSYIDAGFKTTVKGAEASASRLLRQVKVSKYLGDIRKKAVRRTQISVETLIKRNARIAFASLEKVLKIENGRIVLREGGNLDNLDGISFSESNGKAGYSQSISAKLPDRVKALQEIARLTGAYEKSETDDNPEDSIDELGTILDFIENGKK